MKSVPYRPSLQEGTRVLFVHDKHLQDQKTATILNVLPNPSQTPAHQWYDIRFDDGIVGRFLERHLQKLPATETALPDQASVA